MELLGPVVVVIEVQQHPGTEMARHVAVDTSVIGRGPKLPWGEAEIDFTPPFQRKTYNELFHQHTGVDPASDADVIRLAEELNIATANPKS